MKLNLIHIDRVVASLMEVASMLVLLLMTSCGAPSDRGMSRYNSEVDSLLLVADSLFGDYKTAEALSLQTKAFTRAKDNIQKARIQVAMAQCHYFVGDMIVARTFLEQAISIYDTYRSAPSDSIMKLKMDALLVYADLLQSMGDTKESIRQLMRSATLADRLHDETTYVSCQMTVLQHEEYIGNYATAIDGYRQLLTHCNEETMMGERFIILGRLHKMFLSIGNADEAEYYLSELKANANDDEFNMYFVDVVEMRQCMYGNDVCNKRTEDCVTRLRQDVENPVLSEFYEYNAMGLLAEYYMKREMFDSARYYIDRYCGILSGDSNHWIYAYANIIHAQTLLHDNSLDSARVILENGDMAKVCSNSVELSSRYYGTLSDYYFKVGNFRESYRCICRMTELSDSLKAEALSHNFAYRDMAHQRDTTILSNNIKISQKQSKLDSLAFWQTVWIILIIASIIIALTIALNKFVNILKEREREIFQQNLHLQHEVVRHTAVLQSQKIELERTNEKLNKEIEYASRIQHDILPAESRLQSPLLEGHLLFYRPCAHISGDFYWFYQVGDKLFICCADATGHGIPGAFVAMVCSTILNDIVSIPDITASGLMAELDSNMRNILLNNVNIHGNDSVDMSLVCIDNQSGKVTLALSRHYAHIVRADGTIESIQGVKRSIGDLDEAFIARPFVEHELSCDEGDCLFLTTDGLESQFGGPDGKKLKRKRLTELFKSLASLNSADQKAYIDKYFNEWKGECEQTDDVLVIGLRFKKK